MLDAIKRGLFENGIILNSDIHLAVVNEPFLTYIKNGEKVIETRFTKNKIAPYHQIHEDDIVCMKAAGKSIDSIFIVGKSQFYENNANVLSEIKKQYSNVICAYDDSFWEIRKEKKFISLIWIKRVIKLDKAFNVPKKDKRAWIKFDAVIPQNIFLIAGKIGSGKTYWADKIAEHFHCARASFSSYIKYCCTRESIECTRHNMQNLDARIVKNELDQYINYTVALNCEKHKNIIIDGLRHDVVYNRIKELFPKSNIVLIYVDCEEKQRIKNLFIRGDESLDADKDAMEVGAINLKAKAHYILHSFDNEFEVYKNIAQLFCVSSLLDLV